MPPKNRSASVTTGLKWAPDTDPNARISATSPPAVAVEFSSNCSPTSPGDNRTAAIPDPTTTATSNAVPTASAVRRRARVGLNGPRQRSAARPAALTGGWHGIGQRRDGVAERSDDFGTKPVVGPVAVPGRLDEAGVSQH